MVFDHHPDKDKPNKPVRMPILRDNYFFCYICNSKHRFEYISKLNPKFYLFRGEGSDGCCGILIIKSKEELSYYEEF